VCAAFNYGMKPTTYSLPSNPALGTDRRRVPEPGVLLFYSPEEIEAIARSLEAGFQPPPAPARRPQRQDFVPPDDYVFCNALGRPLDGSALRRRYKRARDASGLRPLRWHDLRHTFGALLVARGGDTVTIKDAMGHSQLTPTSRYLHARPATERAAAFTAAFGGSANTAS